MPFFYLACIPNRSVGNAKMGTFPKLGEDHINRPNEINSGQRE